MQRGLFLLLLAPLILGCGGRGPVTIPEEAVLKKLPPGTHHESAEVPGVGSVKYTVEVPNGYDGKTPVPLVLALHYGYDGARPDPYTGEGVIQAFRPGLAGLNAVVIAPDALGGDWTDAKNEQAAVWLTKSAMKTYAIDKKRVVITGFSLGGQGTWFIGSRHQDVFTGAIPVAAPVAGGDTAWNIPVYVIHSDRDDVVPYSRAKKHADAVKQKGARLEFRTVSGLSHYKTAAYGPYVGEAVKWLQGEWKK
ncbi:MAG TPA: dienelactone hydrolase family protein [Gemmataceae bacterium]|nr:dienelactone hydrolase family protein [Gemmataceae bacterium]